MRRLTIALVFAATLAGQKPENVLVVLNEPSSTSRTIADYYVLKRHIPLSNVCRIHSSSSEEISRPDYLRTIAAPIASYLQSRKLVDQVLYIVTTQGVPLRIQGTTGQDGDMASVDSELTLLYEEMRGKNHPLAGALHNPFFGQKNTAFRHPEFPIYLVTRLAGYDFPDVRAMIDRALAAKNVGKFVIDLKSDDDAPGNDWLRTAAIALPKERVVFDASKKALMNERDVIGYASWGSNDRNRKERHLGFHWLPGAIMTEFVSTNARTFERPPDSWNLGDWGNTKTWFALSPQTMTADYIHDGATGASGHVSEPYLHLNPRPDFLLPAYYSGRNLAESYYLSIPGLSWMNIVIGDPLCSLGKPNLLQRGFE